MPPSLTSVSPEEVRLTAMAQRVKEVLPHVPLEVIRIDLGEQCRGVDRGTGSPYLPTLRYLRAETLSLLPVLILAARTCTSWCSSSL